LISQYHCKQYFELFCELIDHYFNLSSLTGVSEALLNSGSAAFNPENLLSSIIDKIKDYNDIAANPSALNENDASGT
jgi:hypothetical protein